MSIRAAEGKDDATAELATGKQRTLFGMGRPLRRGEGLAKALVERVVAGARDRGACRACLWDYEHDLLAITLYERLAFTRQEQPKPLGDDGSRLQVLMTRELGPATSRSADHSRSGM